MKRLSGKCFCEAVEYAVLIDASAIRPTHHIFVGSKAPWYEITDDLPQYEGHKF